MCHIRKYKINNKKQREREDHLISFVSGVIKDSNKAGVPQTQ